MPLRRVLEVLARGVCVEGGGGDGTFGLLLEEFVAGAGAAGGFGVGHFWGWG